MSVQFDPKLRQYTAQTLGSCEVYGNTWSECLKRLEEANRVHLEHKKHNAQPDAGGKQIVLEVEGYCRGRQILNKRLVRVRVGSGSYREAKSDDFHAALGWLETRGYELTETARPKQTMGTIRVFYVYRKPDETHGEALPVGRSGHRDRLFKTEAQGQPIHRHGLSEEVCEYGEYSRDGKS